MPTHKPLPLKQRTSSVDHRRDYSTDTWTSLLGLLKPREFLITVDHFSIWRRHLAWAMEDGKELRDYMTQRYASSMVFMSLLLSTELGVLFNSSGVTTDVRLALMTEAHGKLEFWVGMCIILSAILTVLGLISTFTAWTMVSAVSETNAHCIFRSSIGQYAAELPGRFIVSSIYAFLVWVIMFFFILMPFGVYSNLLLLIAAALFTHTITAFSSFGRVIMHTGAMGKQRIFDPKYEETLRPHTLHHNLLVKAEANLTNHTSIMRQYRCPVEPLRRHYSPDELSTHLSERSSPTPPAPAQRKRTESLVKFADGFDTTGNRVSMPDMIHIPPPPSHGTPMSTLTVDLPSASSSIGRPPLRSNMNSSRSNNTSNAVQDPSPAQAMRKAFQNTDNTALFAKWLSNENGGGQLSTVMEPSSSADGASQKSTGSTTSDASDQAGDQSIMLSRRPSPAERSQKSTPSSFLTVPIQIGSRSFSAVSALDELETRDLLTDEERFDQEYGQLFEPYDNETHDNSMLLTPRMGSSEQDHLLERTERGESNNHREKSYSTMPVPDPRQ